MTMVDDPRNDGPDPLSASIPLSFRSYRNSVVENVRGHPLIVAMAGGELSAIRAYYRGFWHFVDRFPRLIDSGCMRNRRHIVAAIGREGLRRAAGIVRRIREDEENHAALWVRGASTVGLTKSQLQQSALIPAVGRLCKLIAESDPFELFLRVWTMEVIATAISRMVLDSSSFCTLVGERGDEWFRVHVDHHKHGWSHAEIAINLAILMYQGSGKRLEPISETTVFDYRDTFSEAALACTGRRHDPR